MLASVLVLAAAASCAESEPVTLSFAANASLESVAVWVSKSLCVAYTVDPSVAKKTLPVALSGTVSRSTARELLKVALAEINVELRTDHVMGPPVDMGAVCETFSKAVHAVNDHERTVSRAVFDADWSHCALTHVRLVPVMHDGATSGFKLYAIRPDSIWGAAGFLNGDELVGVNERSLATPELAIAAYEALRKADQLDFTVRRRGVLMHLIVTVTK